jgi:hypothetical protein
MDENSKGAPSQYVCNENQSGKSMDTTILVFLFPKTLLVSQETPYCPCKTHKN